MIEPPHAMCLALVSAGSKHEVVRRCAVSRAYYAIYHAATQACKQLALDPPSGHMPLVRFLRTRVDKRWRRLGDRLFDLKKAREKADYRWSESVPVEESMRYVHAAKAAMRLIKDILADSAPNQA